MSALPDIEILRGTTAVLRFVATAGGEAFDLTGCTLRLTVKRVADSADDDAAAVLTRTITTFAAPTTGIEDITLGPGDTRDLMPGRYAYDFLLDDSLGRRIGWKSAAFTLTNTTTRRTTG